MNQLTQSSPFELDLTISNPTNNKTYNQNVCIDCLEFKGYINLLKINDETVEIKYLDGDGNINLAPIAGYSNILQELQMVRINNAWFCLSKMQLFYNSVSNRVFDNTPPVITLNGSSNINHQINTTYTDDGALSSIDNIDGNITNAIVVSNNVNIAVKGVYNVIFSSTDNVGNTTTATRVVNIIDTIAPVVVLNGASTISVSQNGTYTELGATATDNSNEVMTVVITGTVNTAVVGDYTRTYTATDSTGNTHSIGRLIQVTIPVPTLQYSNPATDLFQYLNFQSNIAGQTYDTQADWTISSGTAWTQGVYQVRVTSYRGDATSPYYESLFSNQTYAQNTKYFEHRLYTHPFKLQNGGTVTGDGSSQWNGSFAFVPYTVVGSGTTYTLDFTTAGCQTGEYMQFTFPFFLRITKFTLRNEVGYMPNRFQLVASNNLTTWDVLGLIQPMGTSGTYNLTVTLANGHVGYKYFRFIMYQSGSGRALYENVYIYGDVYK